MRSTLLAVPLLGMSLAAGAALAPAHAAPAATVAPALSAARVNAQITALLPGRMASSRLGGAPGAVLAVEVRDARTGGLVFARKGTSALRGASTQKVLTAAVALQTMGRDARFPTRVRLLGTSGHSADIAIVGGGDPLLTSTDLDSLAARTATALRARGLTSVRVLLDDTLFPAPTPAIGWPSDYTPDVVRPVRPLVRDSRLMNDVAVDAARWFAGRLAARGPSASYSGRRASSPSAVQLAATSGHTVEQAVRLMLQVSENQVAEMLFRLSALKAGKPATWAGASAHALATLADLGVPLAGVRMRDGSGASRDDRLTGIALDMVLVRAVDTAHYPRLWPIWAGKALPVAGRTGSLASRYASAPSQCAAVVTEAKTGSLHDVLSLSGVTVGVDGVPRVFTILLQNPPVDRYGGRAVRVAIDGLAATVNGCWK